MNFLFFKFKKKKGFLFIMDVVVGFAILVIGLSLLISYFSSIPSSSQPKLYSDDLMVFLTSTRFGEFSTNLTRDWISTGFIEENDLVSEKISEFCKYNKTNNFTDFVDETLGGLIPEHLDFSVLVINNSNYFNSTSYFLDEYCLEYYPADLSRINISPYYSTSRTMILATNSSKDLAGDVDLIGPFVLEVTVW